MTKEKEAESGAAVKLPADPRSPTAHAENALHSVHYALEDASINSDARAELEAAKRALTRAVDKLPATDDPVLALGPVPPGGPKPPTGN